MLFADIKNALQDLLSPPKPSVYITEILDKDNARGESPEMSKAQYNEIKVLLDRGTFKVVLERDLPEDANLMPAHLVFALKSTEDGSVKFKSLYTILGNRYFFKYMMVHRSTTVQAFPSRLLLALSSMLYFKV